VLAHTDIDAVSFFDFAAQSTDDLVEARPRDDLLPVHGQQDVAVFDARFQGRAVRIGVQDVAAVGRVLHIDADAAILAGKSIRFIAGHGRIVEQRIRVIQSTQDATDSRIFQLALLRQLAQIIPLKQALYFLQEGIPLRGIGQSQVGNSGKQAAVKEEARHERYQENNAEGDPFQDRHYPQGDSVTHKPMPANVYQTIPAPLQILAQGVVINDPASAGMSVSVICHSPGFRVAS